MSYHISNRSINKGNRVKVRSQLNNRPGLLNNFVVLPTAALHNCLLNPFFLINFNCNNVLLDLTNLVTIPFTQKIKTNEPLLTITPFLCYFLSPTFHSGVNRVNMDYYCRYLWLKLSWWFYYQKFSLVQMLTLRSDDVESFWRILKQFTILVLMTW